MRHRHPFGLVAIVVDRAAGDGNDRPVYGRRARRPGVVGTSSGTSSSRVVSVSAAAFSSSASLSASACSRLCGVARSC